MRIGFIGFGEAAYLISGGLVSEGLTDVHAYDVNANHTEFGELIQTRAAEHGVNLVASMQALAQQADVIVCATSAKYALEIARGVCEYLTPNHVYVDINAASPMVKEQIADLLAERQVKFVDAAVMDSVPKHNHKVPMLLSGDGSSAFQLFGLQYHMNLSVVGPNAGRASAIKMARSVFMKGITMLLFETLQLASKYDADDIVLDSLNESFTRAHLSATANLLMTRTVNHAERRVGEMSEVQETLTALNLDGVMADATKAKLSQLVRMGLNEHFHYETPESYAQVLKAIAELSQDNSPAQA